MSFLILLLQNCFSIFKKTHVSCDKSDEVIIQHLLQERIGTARFKVPPCLEVKNS